MSKREAIARYNLIIKKVRKHPSDFNEIADYLSFESEIQGYNFSISKRTFKRDLDDIRSLYNIDIVYDFSKKVYFIDTDNPPDAHNHILEAFDTFNALSISDRLSNYIHFEKRKPAGTENLFGLLHAIKNRLLIKFSYLKFWEDEITLREVEPYALKEFKNRWYLLSKDLKDGNTKTFALDRLSDLNITNKSFQFPDDFNVEESFKHCFGIITPGKEKLQEIILSFDPFQGKYIKSLPLHHSQEIIVDTSEELRIKLKLFVTFDFLQEILSHGESVKVLQPQSLTEEVRRIYQQALNQY